MATLENLYQSTSEKLISASNAVTSTIFGGPDHSTVQAAYNAANAPQGLAAFDPNSPIMAGQMQPAGKKSAGATDVSGNPYETVEYPPTGLGLNQYPHYMIYYINVNSRSKIKQNIVPADQVAKNTAGASFSGSTTAVGIFNTGIQTGNTITDAATSGINAVGGMFGATPLTNRLKAPLLPTNTTPSYKRLKTAICLPMPNSVVSNSTAKYEEATLGSIGAMLASAASGQAGGTTAIGAQALAHGAIQAAATLAGESRESATAILDKMMGAVINKRAEQIFRSIDFRQYQFNYLFVPKNEVESMTVNDIIKMFRANMHPELNEQGDNAILLMPSEFDIEFRYRTGQNTTIPKIATCCLREVKVNYTPIGEFIAFEGTPNPVAIVLELLFQELEPIYRGMIDGSSHETDNMIGY